MPKFYVEDAKEEFLKKHARFLKDHNIRFPDDPNSPEFDALETLITDRGSTDIMRDFSKVIQEDLTDEEKEALSEQGKKLRGKEFWRTLGARLFSTTNDNNRLVPDKTKGFIWVLGVGLTVVAVTVLTTFREELFGDGMEQVKRFEETENKQGETVQKVSLVVPSKNLESALAVRADKVGDGIKTEDPKPTIAIGAPEPGTDTINAGKDDGLLPPPAEDSTSASVPTSELAPPPDTSQPSIQVGSDPTPGSYGSAPPTNDVVLSAPPSVDRSSPGSATPMPVSSQYGSDSGYNSSTGDTAVLRPPEATSPVLRAPGNAPEQEDLITASKAIVLYRASRNQEAKSSSTLYQGAAGVASQDSSNENFPEVAGTSKGSNLYQAAKAPAPGMYQSAGSKTTTLVWQQSQSASSEMEGYSKAPEQTNTALAYQNPQNKSNTQQVYGQPQSQNASLTVYNTQTSQTGKSQQQYSSSASKNNSQVYQKAGSDSKGMQQYSKGTSGGSVSVAARTSNTNSDTLYTKGNQGNTASINTGNADSGGMKVLFQKGQPTAQKAPAGTTEKNAESSSLPYFVGQQIPARLDTSIVVIPGGSTPVILRGEDKSIWIGSATLDSTKRISISIKQVVVGGVAQNASGTIFDNQSEIGLGASFEDKAPSVASDLFQAGMTGVSNYVNSLTAPTSSLVGIGSGGVSVNTQNNANLGAQVLGSIASLFKVPEQKTPTMVTVARVSKGTEVLIAFGVTLGK